MNSPNSQARVAGMLYLIIVITGYFSLMYVPGKLIVHGDTAATIHNVLEFESLFRANILVGIVASIVFLFLALSLYRLLKEVSQSLAAIMVILVLVQVPITFAGVLNQTATLELAHGADYLSAFSAPQREALAMLFIKLDSRLTITSELLWGLWLLPLGLLVYRSSFLPRLLGLWLGANGIAYVATCFIGILSPQYLEITNKITFPILLGEVAFMLWLLIMGAKTPRTILPNVKSGTNSSDLIRQ